MRIYRLRDADGLASLTHPKGFGDNTVSRITAWQPLAVTGNAARVLRDTATFQKAWYRLFELRSPSGTAHYRLQFAVNVRHPGKEAGTVPVALRVRFADHSWADTKEVFTLPANWSGHLLGSVAVKRRQLQAGITKFSAIPPATR